MISEVGSLRPVLIGRRASCDCGGEPPGSETTGEFHSSGPEAPFFSSPHCAATVTVGKDRRGSKQSCVLQPLFLRERLLLLLLTADGSLSFRSLLSLQKKFLLFFWRSGGRSVCCLTARPHGFLSRCLSLRLSSSSSLLPRFHVEKLFS